MYVTFDVDGAPTGFYLADIHADIPVDAIEISDVQHLDMIRNPGRRRWDAGIGDVIVFNPPVDAGASKAAARARIDTAAEYARLRFITPGAGQALIYQRKESQARACLAAHAANNPPALGAYPALDAEVGITGADTLGVAQVVVGLADAWGAIADQIEALRLAAKAAIAAVPDDAPDLEAQIAAIEAGIVWPAP